jgi:hypothetical protein
MQCEHFLENCCLTTSGLDKLELGYKHKSIFTMSIPKKKKKKSFIFVKRFSTLLLETSFFLYIDTGPNQATICYQVFLGLPGRL